MNLLNYTIPHLKDVVSKNRTIRIFPISKSDDDNIDESVVASFGEEWSKFHTFTDKDISDLSHTYFDIITNEIINKETYMLDAGCGSGRFSKFLSARAGFIEAMDPSNAIFAADTLIGKEISNIRLTKASINNMPFADESFDFVMSIGVLHHIPDTQQAMNDCVRKVKKGGYFYTYLYYKLDNRGAAFKFIYEIVTLIRKGISALPSIPKKIACDIATFLLYMPVILLGRLIKLAGLRKLAAKLPLAYYQDKSFFIIRNDALDRLGTTLEQRFSKKEVTDMMSAAGLEQIVVSDIEPYWHAVGKRAG